MRAALLIFGLTLMAPAAVGAEELLADANKDGKVTLTEYQINRRQFLMRADHNRDGKLDPVEWNHGAAMLRAEIRDTGTPGWSLIGKAGVFGELDTNHDGIVTPGEIDALSAARFPRFDLNHDGAVSRQEVIQLERKARKP